jgi:hypothetical protein
LFDEEAVIEKKEADKDFKNPDIPSFLEEIGIYSTV